jgi:RNA polymerase sigma-70 factor (ECF subfamily)
LPCKSEKNRVRLPARGQRVRSEKRGSLRGSTDQELLEGLRRSSEAHFTELYARYFPRIYGFVYSRIGSHADAEEVVQETFTVVFRSIGSYRGQSSLLSWIYGIAKNTLNSHLRRARARNAGMERMARVEPQQLLPSGSLSDCSPEEHLNMRRYARAIRERLDAVAEWQTQVFAMRHLENLSIREISERTERSSDAIRSSLYRVKRILLETAAQTGCPTP